MTWGHVSSADLREIMAFADPACFPRKHHARIYGPAPITDQTPKPDSLPPLILSATMQRAAMIADHASATTRRDMQALHRIEADLRSLTNRILAKGASSNA